MVEINNIEIYSMHIDLKSVVAERFIRKFTYKICKYMTSVSKHNFKKLPKILKKYCNTMHTSINMMPIAVKLNIYVNFLNASNIKNWNLWLAII